MSQNPDNPAPEAESTSQKDSPERLPLREKIAYGMGTTNEVWGNWLLPAMVWPVFGSFLLMDPALIGLALLVNRLIDAVSDPFFGWLSDNTRSRWGRRRPFILVGSLLAAIALPLFFVFLQEGWNDWTYFWYFVIGSGIYITIVSCFNMPYQSLGAEMTPDYDERTSLFAFKSGIQKIPEIATFAAAAFITLSIFNDASGQPDMLHGSRVFTAVLGVIMALVGIHMFRTLKERYYEKVASGHQEKVKILSTLGGALKCRPFRAQLAIALAFGISTSMLGGLGYNLTVYYVCNGDVPMGSKWNLAMGISGTLLGIGGAIAYSRYANRSGKRPAMFAVLFSAMVVFLGSWFLYNPAIPALQLLATGSISFVTAGFWMLYGAIGADVVDYDEVDSGKRREGAFAACGSYLMKFGLALGMWGSGLVLSWTGFDPSLGGNQAPETFTQMRLAFAGIPIFGIVLAIAALAAFGLTREASEAIRKTLEQRRGKVG